jgi:hypothetical protein
MCTLISQTFGRLLNWQAIGESPLFTVRIVLDQRKVSLRQCLFSPL